MNGDVDCGQRHSLVITSCSNVRMQRQGRPCLIVVCRRSPKAGPRSRLQQRLAIRRDGQRACQRAHARVRRPRLLRRKGQQQAVSRHRHLDAAGGRSRDHHAGVGGSRRRQYGRGRGRRRGGVRQLRVRDDVACVRPGGFLEQRRGEHEPGDAARAQCRRCRRRRREPPQLDARMHRNAGARRKASWRQLRGAGRYCAPVIR